MVIWINGAFGSGKTQTAFELKRRLVNSCIYDPENIGFFITKNIPSSMSKNDFQDHKIWREINFSMIKYIEENYGGIQIIPMTVVNPVYFSELVGKLRSDGVEVNHFTLMASKETLVKRLRSRGEGKNSWAANQIDRCLSSLTDPSFSIHIDTENKSIEEVVEFIASECSIKLEPDSSGNITKKLRRLMTQLKHLRLFN